MGEHPPLLTPQGPGVSRARRPGFPRVEDSRTSRVLSSFPDSLGITPPFAVSASRPGSHHFFPRFDTGSSTGLPALVALVFPSASFPFLPFPCVQFSPVLSTLVRAYLLGMVPLPRLCFPLPSLSLRPVLSSSVTFSSASPPLPPASFPFLPLPFVQFSPVLSTLVRFVLPPSSRPLGVPTLLPFSFRIPGSAAPLSGLGFCGPRVAPKRPHTTPQERQRQQGRFGHLNLPSKPRSPLETEV